MPISLPRRARNWRQVALELSLEYDSARLASLIYELLEAIEQQLLDGEDPPVQPIQSNLWIN